MKRGFTLIEIMLALLVVTVGIVAVTGLLGTSLDSSAKSHDDLNAVSFSDMVFNYLHSSTNWGNIPPDGSWVVPDFNGNDLDLQSGQFTYQVPGPENPSQEYTVSYALFAQDRGGDIKELTLQVWPGYGTAGEPRHFYTEIYRWGKNP